MCKECEIDRLETRIKQLEDQVTSLQTLNTELTLKNRSAWLPTIQIEHAEWNDKQPWANKSKNAGVPRYFEPILGITEESGELSHAFLKLYQGIRGTKEEHLTEAKDAIGDIAIYTIHLCNVMGWDLQTIIHDTWNKVVKKRDWNKDNLSGIIEKGLLEASGTNGIVKNITPARKALHTYNPSRETICCTATFFSNHLHPIKLKDSCTLCGLPHEVGDHIRRSSISIIEADRPE